MKKLKPLYWLTLLSIVLYAIQYLINVYFLFNPPSFLSFSEEFYSQFILGYYTQFVGFAFSILIFIALFFIKSSIKGTIKNGYFNVKSFTSFRIAGSLFLISGSLSFLWDVILIWYSKGKMTNSVTSDLLLVLIGFGLWVISDIVKNGYLIKQENDLTI